MGINVNELTRIILHFAMFGFSFYALSSLDLGKVLLPGPGRGTKAQLLLILLSLALGYLSAQFLLAIVYQL